MRKHKRYSTDGGREMRDGADKDGASDEACAAGEMDNNGGGFKTEGEFNEGVWNGERDFGA